MAEAAILDFGKIAIISPGLIDLAQISYVNTKYYGELDHVTKNAICPKFKMAAAANLDFIKVPFICRGWVDSRQIWYAGAEYNV